MDGTPTDGLTVTLKKASVGCSLRTLLTSIGPVTEEITFVVANWKVAEPSTWFNDPCSAFIDMLFENEGLINWMLCSGCPQKQRDHT